MPSETHTAAPLQSASAPAPIKVAIIEDLRDIREGLASLIKFTDGYRCTGSFRSMEEALEKIRFELPNIMLVDIGLPGMSGIEGIRLLKESYPAILLLMLTVYDDDEMIFDALCAGACGYLLKKTPPARLIESLNEAMSGGAPMSPEVARRVLKLFREIRPPDRADYKLTPHELRLLKLLVEGHNYKTAAVALDVKVSTIAFHMRNIYEKLQVHSKSEASLKRSAIASSKSSKSKRAKAKSEKEGGVSSLLPRFLLPFFFSRSYLIRRRRPHSIGVFMCEPQAAELTLLPTRGGLPCLDQLICLCLCS